MKFQNFALTAFLAAVGASPAVQAQYQSPPYVPPAPPRDSGPYNDPNYQGNPNYQGDPNGQYGDQGYDDQQPYYDSRPDGNYDDGSYDDQYNQYNPQAYSDNQGPVDESVFYGELSPYGRWIQRGSYGWVWEPTRVSV